VKKKKKIKRIKSKKIKESKFFDRIYSGKRIIISFDLFQ